MTELSVLIPARNEQFLQRTIQDILQHIEGDTEVIAVLDGYWPDPPIEDHPRVRLIHHEKSIGQRAATNEAARLSTAEYLIKCDAHCAFDQGFDVKMMAAMQDNWTMAPTMRNLHAFDWVCTCGERRYQGPTPTSCPKCSNTTNFERDVVWIAKHNPQSNSYCFDSEPHFQYFGAFNKRPEGKGDLTESMSLQGSFFMLTRDKYWDLEVCDENFGSWGSQGIEVAVKTWLSGGKVMINHNTFYGHMFRTQGGDFGFPYPISGKQVENAKKTAKSLFFENKWPKQVYPLSWLVERFWPVPGWSIEDLSKLKQKSNGFGMISIPSSEITKGIIYYTDNQLEENLAKTCRDQILKSKNGYDLVSISLQPIDFGTNIHLPLERGYLTMFKQQLAGLEASDADIIFFCEHDILYHPSHFEFIPPRPDVFYYNTNVWKVDANTGHALFCNNTRQTSGLCAYRELLIQHYRERVRRVEAEGYSTRIGFEPGTHNRPERIDNFKADSWMSPLPNLDIRHGKNLTRTRWRKDQFRNQKYTEGWKETDSVEGWYEQGEFSKLLEVTNENHGR